MKMQHPYGFVPTMANATQMPQKTLAMAYVVDQAWRDLYPTEQGFIEGTIFRELNFPLAYSKTGGGYHAR